MSLELQKIEHQDTMQVFGNQTNFECAMRMAKALSASSIVPTSYQGDKGLPNCIIALEMANRMGASPMMVMQNLYVVHGNPSWSSKFLIATLNQCGKFTSLRYEQENQGTDKWRCRAYAIEKSTGETLYSPWVSIEMAKKEGWYSKGGSKWQTMPELMLMYRAGAFFQRTYAPEIGMGMQTKEEMEDITPIEIINPVEQEIKENANQEMIGAEEPAESQSEEAAIIDAPANEPEQPSVEKIEAVGEQEMPDIFKA